MLIRWEGTGRSQTDATFSDMQNCVRSCTSFPYLGSLLYHTILSVQPCVLSALLGCLILHGEAVCVYAFRLLSSFRASSESDIGCYSIRVGQH